MWDDRWDPCGIETYLEAKGLTKADIVHRGISYAISENSYNPVQEWIKSKPWDGVKRCDTLLIDMLGAEDNKTNRFLSSLLVQGILMKVFKSPIKFDYSICLFGEQGTMKSTFCEKLGCQFGTDIEPTIDPTRNWYLSVGTKNITDAIKLSLRGKIVCEMNEMSVVNSNNTDILKSFLTTTVDQFRMPYGHDDITVNRTAVFIGTTNSDQPFTDPTGCRRFLPVYVNPSEENRNRLAALDRAGVQQIYAEMYKSLCDNDWKANLWKLPAEVQEDIESLQEGATIEDPWAPDIRKWLEEDVPAQYEDIDWNKLSPEKRIKWRNQSDDIKEMLFEEHPEMRKKRNVISYKMIWTECIHPDKFMNDMMPDMTTGDQWRMRAIMATLQKTWKYKPRVYGLPEGYPPSRGYERKLK